jgi:hypothetical protein
VKSAHSARACRGNRDSSASPARTSPRIGTRGCRLRDAHQRLEVGTHGVLGRRLHVLIAHAVDSLRSRRRFLSRRGRSGARRPMRASQTVGLNADGGTLPSVSPLVSVSVTKRCGWLAATICAVAPPVSLGASQTRHVRGQRSRRPQLAQNRRLRLRCRSSSFASAAETLAARRRRERGSRKRACDQAFEATCPRGRNPADPTWTCRRISSTHSLPGGKGLHNRLIPGIYTQYIR